ncbi:unnamed protein product, partial [marine sediment metagenome]
IKQTQIFVFLFASLILGGTFITVAHFRTQQSDDNKLDTLNLSTVKTIDYMEWAVVSAKGVGPSGNVHWEFSGSNNYVGIILWVMDSENYAKFQNLEVPDTFYIESDGSYYVDSGDFSPPQTATWYFLFVNFDSDEESTILTYSIECTGCSPGGPNVGLIIGIVVGIIAVAAVGGFLLYRKKMKGREEPITPEKGQEIPVTKKEPIEYTKIVDGIKNLFEVSGNRIDLEMLRDIVPMDKPEFNAKVLDLAKQYGFKIELE